MSRKKHTLDEVLRVLKKKNEVQVYPNGKVKYVVVLNKCQELGNGSWGKIDYLVNHNGYKLIRVNNFHDFNPLNQ